MGHCTCGDLTNLACTSSTYRNIVQEVLSHTVRIPAAQLRKHGFWRVNKLVKKIERLKMTKVLRLTSLSVSAHAVKAISKLDNLLELDVRKCENVCDADIVVLCALVGLRRLDVSFTAVGDVGLLHIKDMTLLEELALTKCSITDDGMSHLTSLKHLR